MTRMEVLNFLCKSAFRCSLLSRTVVLDFSLRLLVNNHPSPPSNHKALFKPEVSWSHDSVRHVRCILGEVFFLGLGVSNIPKQF